MQILSYTTYLREGYRPNEFSGKASRSFRRLFQAGIGLVITNLSKRPVYENGESLVIYSYFDQETIWLSSLLSLYIQGVKSKNIHGIRFRIFYGS